MASKAKRQLVRVSCALVVVVCPCVLRVTWTRLTDRNKHWIISGLPEFYPFILSLFQINPADCILAHFHML